MYGIGTIINIKWLAMDTHEKLQERIQSRLPVQVPSLNAPECSKWILTSRGLWITVHRCAKRKRTSIMCVSNLPSLPWNVTGKVHKIRTTLTRRSNLPACFGKRTPDDAGKSRLPGKAAAAAAAAAAILCQYIRERSPFTSKKEITKEDRIWTTKFSDSRRAENIPLKLSSSSISGLTPWLTWKRRSESNALGCHNSSIEKKIPKSTGDVTCEDWLHCFYSRTFRTKFWNL